MPSVDYTIAAHQSNPSTMATMCNSQATKESRNPDYSAKQIAHFDSEIIKLKSETAAIKIDLSILAGQLTKPRARTFLNEGIGRRLPLVERSTLNIYKIYPPSKTTLLTQDECEDIAIQLHAFAINVYALFDNITWVCMLEAGENLPPLRIGPFKKECQPFLPKLLREYLAQPQARQWFQDYGKLYRDSTAHRIPPYIPRRTFSPEETVKYRELDTQSLQQLSSAADTFKSDRKLARQMLETHERLEQEKRNLGSNSLLIALSLTGEDASQPVYMHPQLLSDWMLANDLVKAFIRAMREHHGWQQPSIPEIRIAK